MNLGSLVKLKKKDVKQFYETYQNLEMYNLDDEEKGSTNFVEFVSDYLGFTNGLNVGMIIDINRDTACVVFKNPLTEEESFSYFSLNELEDVSRDYYNRYHFNIRLKRFGK